MIAIVGISYKTTPLETRELLAFSPDETVDFLQQLTESEFVKGAVLVSTCNRTELYFDTDLSQNEAFRLIFNEILKFKNLVEKIDSSVFYYRTDIEAIKHLFAVAAGMDSMVVGETQILGQLKDAFRFSNENNCTSGIINRLFHKAFEAGKKVRNLHPVKSVPVSAGSVAVDYVNQLIENKDKTKVLIIGAGQMAEIVVISLLKSGYQDISVYNRTSERALKLAVQHHVRAVADVNYLKTIQQSKLIFVATSSLKPVLTQEHFQHSTSSKILFDLAVPRNIDAEVGQLPDIKLFDVDNLQLIGDEEQTAFNVKLAAELIDTLAAEFGSWLSSLDLSPTIDALQTQFDEVLENRLKFLRHKLTPEEYKLVAQTGKFFKDKYLRNIIHGVRELSENGKKPQYVELINQMLDNYKK